MEDASGEDLDWFWRGWFYGTEPCDIALDSVRWSKLSNDTAQMQFNNDRPAMPSVAKPIQNSFEDISKIRNKEDKNIVFATDADITLRDFYWRYDRGLAKVDTTLMPVTSPTIPYQDYTTEEKMKMAGGKFLYELTLTNKGGLVMPVIIEWTFKDSTKQTDRISVYVWRKNENKVVKTFLKDKEVASIKIDPMRETADINEQNNRWPVVEEPGKFQLFKSRAAAARGAAGGNNPMQREIKQ